mmetsp:Transcript_15267/g.58035  ORF Transcript_15267/g.58035 Transcript_15267/m.58035 type:complete len:302 (+) Transcript_15267:56-961(+)
MWRRSVAKGIPPRRFRSKPRPAPSGPTWVNMIRSGRRILPNREVSQRVVDNYKEIEARLMRTTRASNVEQIRLALTAAALVTVWVFSVFGRHIRRFFSKQTAEVARETLENEELQARTQELAAAVVRTILNDEDILVKITAFIRNTADDDNLRDALVQLALHILQHDDTLAEVKVLGLKLVDYILKDETVTIEAGALVQRTWNLPEVRTATLDLLVDLLQTQEVNQAVLALLTSVADEPVFKSKLQELLIAATHGVVIDKGVHTAAKDFVHEVVTDTDVQRTGGRSLRASVWYSLEPVLAR